MVVPDNLTWLVPFAIGFVAATGLWIALGLLRLWFDLRITRKESRGPDVIDEQNEVYQNALKLIAESRKRLRMSKQLNPEWISPLFEEVPVLVEGIARLYYPSSSDPVKAPKLGEFSRAVELAATDIANFLQDRRIGRLVDLSAGSAFRSYDRAKKIADVPFLRLFAPVYRKLRPVVQVIRYKSPLTWVGLAMSNAAARVLQPPIIDIVGKRAIQLYSGELGRSD